MTMKPALARSLRLFSLVGLGAILMVLSDPSAGRRRRGYAREKVRHGGRATALTSRRTWTRGGDRFHRLGAMTRSFFGDAAPPHDDVLVARIRSRLGHVIAHPHAVSVKAQNGHVSFTGSLPPRDVQRLFEAVSSVRGVTSVESHVMIETARAAGC
jgi:hyperosmotically inducible periplasmic protein